MEIDARGLLMAEARRMWTLAAATLERDIRLHDMTEDEERVMIGAVLSAAERHYEAQSATIERMREALTEIAQPVVCPPYDLDEAFAQREAIRDIARIATKGGVSDET